MNFGPQNLFDQLEDKELDTLRSFFCGVDTIRMLGKNMPLMAPGCTLAEIATLFCKEMIEELAKRDARTLEVQSEALAA